MRCPQCGSDGGVLLLFSVAPCDRCAQPVRAATIIGRSTGSTPPMIRRFEAFDRASTAALDAPPGLLGWNGWIVLGWNGWIGSDARSRRDGELPAYKKRLANGFYIGTATVLKHDPERVSFTSNGDTFTMLSPSAWNSPSFTSLYRVVLLETP